MSNQAQNNALPQEGIVNSNQDPNQLQTAGARPVYNLQPYLPNRSPLQQSQLSTRQHQQGYYTNGVHGQIHVIGFNDTPLLCCCGLGVAAKVLAIVNLLFIGHTVLARPFQIIHLDWDYTHGILLFPDSLSYLLFKFLNVIFPVLKKKQETSLEELLIAVKSLTCMRPTIWLEFPLFIANLFLLLCAILFLIAVFVDTATVSRESQIKYCNTYMMINYFNPEVVLRAIHFAIVVGTVPCGGVPGVVVFGVLVITGLWSLYNGIIATNYMTALTMANVLPVRSQAGLSREGGVGGNSTIGPNMGLGGVIDGTRINPPSTVAVGMQGKINYTNY